MFAQLGNSSANERLHVGYGSRDTITLRHHSNDVTFDINRLESAALTVFRFANGETPSHFINYNGILVGSGQTGGALTNSGNNYIGNFADVHFYHGKIKEILVFDTNLLDEELIKNKLLLIQEMGA